MINKLLPEQISNYWDIISYAIENSLPPIVGNQEDRMNRILSSALSGQLDIWVSYERLEEGISLNAVLVTKVLYDDASNTRSLLLYCLYGYRNIPAKSWIAGAKALVKYAISKDCSKILAYTEYEHLIRIATKFGAETKYTLVSLDSANLLSKLQLLGDTQ